MKGVEDVRNIGSVSFSFFYFFLFSFVFWLYFSGFISFERYLAHFCRSFAHRSSLNFPLQIHTKHSRGRNTDRQQPVPGREEESMGKATKRGPAAKPWKDMTMQVLGARGRKSKDQKRCGSRTYGMSISIFNFLLLWVARLAAVLVDAACQNVNLFSWVQALQSVK